jgi:hypothetical protein
MEVTSTLTGKTSLFSAKLMHHAILGTSDDMVLPFFLVTSTTNYLSNFSYA